MTAFTITPNIKFSKRVESNLKSDKIRVMHDMEQYTFKELGDLFGFSPQAAYKRYKKSKGLTNG